MYDGETILQLNRIPKTMAVVVEESLVVNMLDFFQSGN